MNKIVKIPQNVEEKVNKWFTQEKKLAFFSTLFLGILIHIIIISNLLLKGDGIVTALYHQSGVYNVSLGRWGILLTEFLRAYIAIPQVTIIISLVIISISVTFLIDLLKLKNKISIFLISLSFSVAPTLMHYFLWPFTADTYCWGILLSILAVRNIYLIKSQILKMFCTTLCIALAVGIYQSHLGFILVLMIIIPVLNLLKGEEIKKVLKDISYSILGVITGLILYYGITQICLIVFQTDFSSYRGANEVSVLGIIKELPRGIIKTYKTFMEYFAGENIIANSNYNRIFLYSALCLTSLIIMIGTIRKVKQNRIVRTILIIIGLILIPIGINIIEIIVPTTSTYIVMCYQYILIFVFLIALLEITNRNYLKFSKMLLITCIFVILWTYYLANNASYMTVLLSDNQLEATAIRIIDRIEQQEGYKTWMEICFVGSIDNTKLLRDQKNMYEKSYKNKVGTNLFHKTFSGEQNGWKRFLSTYLGFTYYSCSKDDYKEIIESEEFKKMGIFPSKSSVKIINDIMVVKLTDTPVEAK